MSGKHFRPQHGSVISSPLSSVGKKKDGHVIASRGREAAENPGDPNPSLFLHEHPVGNNLASLGCSIPRGCEPYGQHQVFVLRQDLNVLELTL